MLVGFSKGSLLTKARSQPDKVKEVLKKAKVDGVVSTVEAVRSKLGEPIPLGYSSSGIVLAVGESVSSVTPGDLVASNASHGDEAVVNENLCAKVPLGVNADSAAFTVVASIGLQGIRLINPSLGESVVVMGVGLIGLLAVKLLVAHGCRVLAIDHDANKLSLASSFGASVCNLSSGEDPVSKTMAFSGGRGADAVLIAASTESNEPIKQSALMCRVRGRVVLVGVVGLNLDRADFYEKEIQFQVSCSYGPGRYDPNYEVKGQDYPLGYVRWTEKRNFEAILDLMSDGRLVVEDLISKQYSFEDAEKAYEDITSDSSLLGVLFNYTDSDPDQVSVTRTSVPLHRVGKTSVTDVAVGFLGAGNYASRMLIPAFKSHQADLHTLVSSGGVSGVLQGKKNDFRVASTNPNDVFGCEDINAVAIATRHNTHADYVIQALASRKHVYVEKPLALSLNDLDLIEQAHESIVTSGSAPPIVMVGYNRRFSPHIDCIKGHLDARSEPATLCFLMNAGAIPSNHWTQDQKQGGGRIIGEACHYIDLMRFLVGSTILRTHAVCVRSGSDDVCEDKAIITIEFEDGSIGSIHYFANGASTFPKERLEVFSDGRVLRTDNFMVTSGYGIKGFKKVRTWRQEKGLSQCVGAFLNAIESGSESPIPFDQVMEVARATVEIDSSLRHSG